MPEVDLSGKRGERSLLTPGLGSPSKPFHRTPSPSPSRMSDAKSGVSRAEDDRDLVLKFGHAIGGSKGWAKLIKTLSDYDEGKIKDCKEDMDTLLVFAGLFSAVLTAFNVESYKRLQPDQGDIMIIALAQISQQLSSFSASNGFLNSTGVPFLPSTAIASPPSSAVLINAIWFSSLVCSLVTASLAILVKQWLREYQSQDNISSRSRTRVRYWRHLGLTQFRVFDIAAFLPMLLQIALLLFFIGLSVFLLSLNQVVGWVATSLVIAWLAVYVSSTVAPAFSSRCPYKTPLLKTLMRSIRRLLHNVFHETSSFQTANIPSPGFYGDEAVLRHNPSIDIPALVAADGTLLDDEFLETTIRDCLSDMGGREVAKCVGDIIGQRVGHPFQSLIDVRVADLQRLSNMARAAIIHVLIDAVHREIDVRHMHKQEVEWLPWMVGALSCVGSALLPVFPAAGQDRAPVMEVRAGNMLVTLLTQNVLVARGVLEILSYSRYSRLPSSFSISKISSKKALLNIIAASRLIIHEGRVEAAHLCQVVLYLAVFTQDDALRDVADGYRDLLHELAILIKARKDREGSLHSWGIYPANLCRKYSGRLEARLPGIIPLSLSHVLRISGDDEGEKDTVLLEVTSESRPSARTT